VPFYLKNQSVFRVFAVAISGFAAALTLSLLTHATDWQITWYYYVILGLVIWLGYAFLAYQLLGFANECLIKLFASEELNREMKVIAHEIVMAVFDRQTINLPEEDEDFLKREVARRFREYLDHE
jgi:hypothetical protein